MLRERDVWEVHLVHWLVDQAGFVAGRTGLSIDLLTSRTLTTCAGPRYRCVAERLQANDAELGQGGMIGR